MAVQSIGLRIFSRALDDLLCVKNHEMLHVISNSNGTHMDFVITYNKLTNRFEYILTMDNGEQEEHFGMQGINKRTFLQESEQDQFLLIEFTTNNGHSIQKLYQDPKQRWKDTLPKAKKASRIMRRNEVYIDENLGLPKDMAQKISRLTVFGKKKVRSNLKQLKKDLILLKKIKV